jgi:4Fe-4S ferredoxin
VFLRGRTRIRKANIYSYYELRQGWELSELKTPNVIPVVNRNRCEGKGACVEVCPYDVFEVRRIEEADRSKLSLIGKLKSMAHGQMTAYTPRKDLCEACGLCVAACPERAITLVKQIAT